MAYSLNINIFWANLCFWKEQPSASGRINESLLNKFASLGNVFMVWGASVVDQTVKNLPVNAGVAGSIPGLRRSPGEGNDNHVWLQNSFLENWMDRGAWWATVCRVAESDTTEWPTVFSAREVSHLFTPNVLIWEWRTRLQELMWMASLVAQRLKHLPAMRETWVRSLGWEDALEEGMATHSSILSWEIPWMEKLGAWGRKEPLHLLTYKNWYCLSRHLHSSIGTNLSKMQIETFTPKA